MVRAVEKEQRTYVGVTSAMKYLKAVMGEPEDYYGPNGNVHALEGEGCHRTCLDWLAHAMGWLEHGEQAPWPTGHPDEARWHAVMKRCLASFMQFCEQYQVDPIGIEQEDFSMMYRLVGHIDLPCYMVLPKKKVKLRVPVDLKFTSRVLESHQLQVRAYGRLEGMRGSQMGGIFHCDRDTGAWKFHQVNLVENLDDFQAITFAAGLWTWNQKREKA